MEDFYKEIFRECMSRDLVDLLMTRSVKELHSLRKRLDVKNTSHLAKEELAKAIAKAYPEVISEYIYYLVESDYTFLSDVIKNGGILEQISPGIAYKISHLSAHGLCFTVIIDNKKVVAIPFEVIEAFEAINQTELRNVAKENSEILQLIEGMANIYGMIDMIAMHRMIDDLMGYQIDSFRFTGIYFMHENALGGTSLFGISVCSSLCDNSANLYLEHNKRKDLEYKRFDRDFIKRHSNPDFVEPTPEVLAMKGLFLRNYEMTSKEAMLHICIIMMYIKKDLDIQESIDYLTDELDEFTEGFADGFYDLYIRLNLNANKWKLKGHTPLEMLDSLDANLPDTGEYTSDRPIRNNVIELDISRNNPCACGSGLRYRDCCGRK